ncbi:MAG: hypothetical protein EHM87_23910 [Burkholderiales bacterium]|nr:MAG: hypothetical protein EHM87_23910 [Burkholderiales bacterium]
MNITFPTSKKNTTNNSGINKNNRYFAVLILLVLVQSSLLLFYGCSSVKTSIVTPLSINDYDSDSDGISDEQETAFSTNPNNSDTDQDGLSDLFEIHSNLSPLNYDTDNDGISDAEDFMPKTNNQILFLSLGISIVCLVITVLGVVHVRLGLTKKRQQKIEQQNEKKAKETEFATQEAMKIHEYAKSRFGSLTLKDITDEFELENTIIQKCLEILKAKWDGEYYHFPDIEITFKKKK